VAALMRGTHTQHSQTQTLLCCVVLCCVVLCCVWMDDNSTPQDADPCGFSTTDYPAHTATPQHQTPQTPNTKHYAPKHLHKTLDKTLMLNSFCTRMTDVWVCLQELKERGLKVTGRKAELVERLLEWHREHGKQDGGCTVM
jgi:hypothetical protein